MQHLSGDKQEITEFDKCNGKIDDIGIISSPSCSSVNEMNILNSTTRRRRSNCPRIIYYLLSMMSQIENCCHLYKNRKVFITFCLTQKLILQFTLILETTVTKPQFKPKQTYSYYLGYCNWQVFQTSSHWKRRKREHVFS